MPAFWKRGKRRKTCPEMDRRDSEKKHEKHTILFSQPCATRPRASTRNGAQQHGEVPPSSQRTAGRRRGTSQTATPASGPRPVCIRFFEFYRAPLVQSASAAVSPWGTHPGERDGGPAGLGNTLGRGASAKSACNAQVPLEMVLEAGSSPLRARRGGAMASPPNGAAGAPSGRGAATSKALASAHGRQAAARCERKNIVLSLEKRTQPVMEQSLGSKKAKQKPEFSQLQTPAAPAPPARRAAHLAAVLRRRGRPPTLIGPRRPANINSAALGASPEPSPNRPGAAPPLIPRAKQYSFWAPYDQTSFAPGPDFGWELIPLGLNGLWFRRHDLVPGETAEDASGVRPFLQILSVRTRAGRVRNRFSLVDVQQNGRRGRGCPPPQIFLRIQSAWQIDTFCFGVPRPLPGPADSGTRRRVMRAPRGNRPCPRHACAMPAPRPRQCPVPPVGRNDSGRGPGAGPHDSIQRNGRGPDAGQRRFAHSTAAPCGARPPATSPSRLTTPTCAATGSPALGGSPAPGARARARFTWPVPAPTHGAYPPLPPPPLSGTARPPNIPGIPGGAVSPALAGPWSYVCLGMEHLFVGWESGRDGETEGWKSGWDGKVDRMEKCIGWHNG
eukprot:gene11912-biopygen4891